MWDPLYFLIRSGYHSPRALPKSSLWKPNGWLYFLPTGFCGFLTRILISLQFSNTTRTWCVSPGILSLVVTEEKRKSENYIWLIKNDAKKSSLSEGPQATLSCWNNKFRVCSGKQVRVREECSVPGQPTMLRSSWGLKCSAKDGHMAVKPTYHFYISPSCIWKTEKGKILFPPDMSLRQPWCLCWANNAISQTLCLLIISIWKWGLHLLSAHQQKEKKKEFSPTFI